MSCLCVFAGASAGSHPSYSKSTSILARRLGACGYRFVYGGGRSGLMGTFASGAMSSGGHVTGIIPEFLQSSEIGHQYIQSLQIVSTMHERKARMYEMADGIVILPGGLGTLDELMEVLAWNQLGLMNKPLFFLDYLSMSKLNIVEHSKVIESIALACKKAKVSLIGGETAEMPGIYSKNDFDLAGFAVGLVDRLKKLPKEIMPGDLIYGLPSSGPHSNGFTLIRKLLELEPTDKATDLKKSLITPTRLYSDFAQDPTILKICSGFAHITGGGILDNLPRVFPKGLTAKMQLNSWDVPSSLSWAIKKARLSQHQALQTFNCGIGFIAIVPTNKSKEFKIQCKKISEPIVKIGEIIQGNQLEFKGSLNID